jgi:predicted nucleic acid-binding protein
MRVERLVLDIRVCRETAVAGRADCIVTSDQDLPVLHPFRGIRILTPAAFLEAIAAGNGG